MATTFSFSDALSLPISTTVTDSMDVGTDPVAIGVIIAGETMGWNHCTLDGQSLITTHVGYGSFLGTDVGMYWNNSPTSMSGTVTISMNQWTKGTGYAAVFVIHADGAVSILDTASAGTAGYWYGNTVDSGVIPGYAMTLGTSAFNITAQESVATTFSSPDGSIKQVALEDNATSGSRTVGAATLKLAAYFTVVFSTGDIYAQPSSITATQTVPSPTVTGPGNMKIIHQPFTQTMVVPEPTVIHKPQRAMLTQGVHAETPDRLAPPSGFTFPVLSYQGGEPVWVEATSIQRKPRRIVMRPGITDPPEPTANVDGDDYVYMEYDD